jgi:hypothetical protein
LRFSNLVPSNGIAGSVIATSESASGDAKGDNQETFSFPRSAFRVQRSVFRVPRSAFSVRSSGFIVWRSAVALEKWQRAAFDWVHAEP